MVVCAVCSPIDHQHLQISIHATYIYVLSGSHPHVFIEGAVQIQILYKQHSVWLAEIIAASLPTKP